MSRRNCWGRYKVIKFEGFKVQYLVTVDSETTQFIYDGDGNMVKQINPDGSKIIFVSGAYQEVKDSNNAVTETRIYYPAGGAMRINGVLSYRLTDHLGSTVAVTDASGVLVDEQRYMPFGQQRLSNANMLADKLSNCQNVMLLDIKAQQR